MSQEKELTTVSFDAQGLRLDTSQDAETICEQLVHKQVEVLILQGNTFGIEAAERVGLELAKQRSLVEAHFKDLFTSRGKEEVPEALTHLLTGITDSGAELKLLDLSDNAIGPIGAPSVIQFLRGPSCSSLEVLLLNNCGLGPEGSTSIAPCISQLPHLKKFVCGRNRLEDHGATNMSRAISELNSLEVLVMPQNGINVKGITSLVDGALTSNIDSLREIDFSDNTIKEVGSKAIARIIKKACNLRVIKLNDALLENEGFMVICNAIAASPSIGLLESVSFEGNELHGHRIVDLIETTFRGCSPRCSLNLLENDFELDELSRLKALENKDSFVELLLDDIDSDDDDYEDEDEEDEDDDDDDASEATINECKDDTDNEILNGFVNFGNIDFELREIFREFVTVVKEQPFDDNKVNSSFNQMISTGAKSFNDRNKFHAVQLLGEELGLVKMEETRKKKPLQTDAIVYIGKRVNELSPPFKDFFEVLVKNNDYSAFTQKLTI